MTAYLDALREAMSLCVVEPGAILIGQSLVYGGTGLRGTVDHLPREVLFEPPVFENLMLSMAIGMSLAGRRPVVCYPRWSFLLSATEALVQHLDKLPEMGEGWHPRIIVRVVVPTSEPLHPGFQHLGNFSAAFRLMLRNTPVVELEDAEQVMPAYRRALASRGSSVLVEFARLYGE